MARAHKLISTMRACLFLLQNGRLSDGRRLVAGFSAGITEALIIVTPFEVVKIRLQQQKGMARDKLKYHVRIPSASFPPLLSLHQSLHRLAELADLRDNHLEYLQLMARRCAIQDYA